VSAHPLLPVKIKTYAMRPVSILAVAQTALKLTVLSVVTTQLVLKVMCARKRLVPQVVARLKNVLPHPLVKTKASAIVHAQRQVAVQTVPKLIVPYAVNSHHAILVAYVPRKLVMQEGVKRYLVHSLTAPTLTSVKPHA
jgi:hypothetical protein